MNMELPKLKRRQEEIKEHAAQVKAKKDANRTKVIVLNIINLLLVMATIYVLTRLPVEAEKIQQLRSEVIASQESLEAGVLDADIEKASEKIDRLESQFVSEEDFLDLLVELERIKASGIMNFYKFPLSEPVADQKTGDSGLPLTATFLGTQDEINGAFAQLIGLPIMIKDVSIDLEVLEDGRLLLTYNGFIYANEEFSQN